MNADDSTQRSNIWIPRHVRFRKEAYSASRERVEEKRGLRRKTPESSRGREKEEEEEEEEEEE